MKENDVEAKARKGARGTYKPTGKEWWCRLLNHPIKPLSAEDIASPRKKYKPKTPSLTEDLKHRLRLQNGNCKPYLKPPKNSRKPSPSHWAAANVLIKTL